MERRYQRVVKTEPRQRLASAKWRAAQASTRGRGALRSLFAFATERGFRQLARKASRTLLILKAVLLKQAEIYRKLGAQRAENRLERSQAAHSDDPDQASVAVDGL